RSVTDRRSLSTLAFDSHADRLNGCGWPYRMVNCRISTGGGSFRRRRGDKCTKPDRLAQKRRRIGSSAPPRAPAPSPRMTAGVQLTHVRSGTDPYPEGGRVSVPYEPEEEEIADARRSFMSRVRDRISQPDEARIVLLGAASGGKTTYLGALRFAAMTFPTI